MRHPRSRGAPQWLHYVDLAGAAAAGAIWYAFPEAGPWPLVLALAPWAVHALVTRRLVQLSALDFPLWLFVATAALAVWAAYDRPAAWPKFWLIVGGGLLFYALSRAEPLGRVRAWLLAAFGGGVALYFLATHDWDAYPAKIEALMALGRSLQAPLPELPGHRLHPNVAGGIMALMAPFAGWWVLDAWAGMRRAQGTGRGRAGLLLALGLAVSAVTLFGLMMTTSRGAWLGLGSAAALAFLWGATGLVSRDNPGRRAWLLLGMVGALLVAAVGVGLIWPQAPTLLIEALPGAGTGLDRIELARNTLLLARDYAFVGAGLDGFQMLYSTYVLLIHVGFTVHSHNLFLNVAVEQGLPALVMLVWMWALMAAALWKKARRSPGSLGLLGAAALSLVVLLIHGLVDDVLYGSRAVLLLFAPLALATAELRRAERAPRRAAWALPLAMVLVLGLALVFRGPILAQALANLGAVRQSQIELGAYSWPEWPIQDALRRATDLGEPVGYFERALALDAGNATANRRLGQIELSLGEYEEALTHLEAAYGAEPWSPTTRQLYGEALIANGRVEEGAALWSTVNQSQNQLGARVYWYGSLDDAQRAAWIEQAAEAAAEAAADAAGRP